MNKEQLKDAIRLIPRHILRPIAIDDGQDVQGKWESTWINQPTMRAVTEENSTKALTCMSTRYKLVQIKDKFYEIVDQFEGEIVGRVKYDGGFGILDVFPASDEYKTSTGFSIGISAYNSVTRESAIGIRFSVTDGTRILSLPKKIASFRKQHVGNVSNITSDYISLLGKVKASWDLILNKFVKEAVTSENADDIATTFKLDEKAKKYMKEAVDRAQVANLWEYCLKLFDYISTRYYKSDVHMRRRLDELTDTIFLYSFTLRLQGEETTI